jgi:hypothetical protein
MEEKRPIRKRPLSPRPALPRDLDRAIELSPSRARPIEEATTSHGRARPTGMSLKE